MSQQKAVKEGENASIWEETRPQGTGEYYQVHTVASLKWLNLPTRSESGDPSLGKSRE